jgi:TRAP transporter 4TM/12TM fusion protein
MLARIRRDIIGIPDDETIGSMLKKNGILSSLISLVTVSLALFHIITSYVGQLEAFRHRATHLLVIVFLIYLNSIEKRIKSGEKSRKNTFLIFLDSLFALMAVVSLYYTFTNSTVIPLRAGNPNNLDIIIGGAVLFLTIEAARRHVGLGIVGVATFFLFYVYAGPVFPGFLRHAPFTIGEIINVQYLDLEGIWSSPLGAAASFVIVFLLFAGLLLKTGILDVFMDFSMKLVGKSVGGPAKVAVVSSALVGMVSGTSVGNTLLTGQVSIPIMKKMGYKPHFAAAVEAAASTGGQVMPPIMGSAAFIIAMFLGISYSQVCKAALVPALLWFFSLYVIVHLEAKKLNLKRLTDADFARLPSWNHLLRKSYLAIPMILLIAIMVMGFSEVRAGFWGMVSLLVVAWISSITEGTRFTLRDLCSGLKSGIEMAFSVTTACACAGIIVGCIMQSGLGYTMSMSLVEIAKGNAFILLPLVMLAALVLGTGMMTVGVYIIVSVLLIPAMISMGMHTLASHLFAFYFGIICNVTPPVATAAYAAAGVAETSPWATGITAFKLVIPILAVPYVFISQPALLLDGTLPVVLLTVLTAFAGVFCLDVVMTGYWVRKCSPVERLLFAVAGIALLVPHAIVSLVGAVLLAIGFVMQKSLKVEGSTSDR